MKLLLYCTKNKPYLYGNPFILKTEFDHYCLEKQKDDEFFGEHNLLNGKIVAECDFEVEEIKNNLTNNNSHLELSTDKLTEEELFEKSCLSRYEMFNYLQNNFTKKCEPNGYAIHIKNLHIFDEPKDFSEYSKNVEHCKCDECLENCKKYCKYYYAKNNITQTINTGCIKYALLYKAPQNMMYVYDGDEKKVLISIHPEWLCKILNGEKTIEVRKKVLKEMLRR